MYTKEEILEMLQNGQEAEDLAQSFVDALNAALIQKQELDDAAAKAEKEKMRTRSEKILIMEDILNMAFVFIQTYYPKVYSEAFRDELTATDVVDAMDKAYDEICGFTNALDDFMKILEADPVEKNEKPKVKKAKEKNKNIDYFDLIDPIEQFLEENHLK